MREGLPLASLLGIEALLGWDPRLVSQGSSCLVDLEHLGGTWV